MLLVTVAVGTVGTADTSLTTGWTLGTVVVPGEVAVSTGLGLKMITWGARGPWGKWGQCGTQGPWGDMGTVWHSIVHG